MATATSNNVAIGYLALQNNTADKSTAIGTSALQNNTTGTLNTAVGSMALMSNIFGANNTTVGYGSLTQNQNGLDNTAVGKDTGYSNLTGGGNTIMGHSSMYNNANGMRNTAIFTKLVDGFNMTNYTGPQIGLFESVRTSVIAYKMHKGDYLALRLYFQDQTPNASYSNFLNLTYYVKTLNKY